MEPAADPTPDSDKSRRGAKRPDDGDRHPLRRHTGDRVIAGVAGGISRHFGIDPVIVRIGFIVLAFLGGAGLALYLVGWLALPRDTSGSIVTDTLGNDDPHRIRGVAAIVLIGAGLYATALLSRPLFDLFAGTVTAAPYLALMLIAAGAALVLWPRPSVEGPAPSTGPAPTTAASAAQAGAAAVTAPVPAATPTPEQAAVAPPEAAPAAASPAHAPEPTAASPAQDREPTAASPAPPAAKAASGPVNKSRRRRQRSATGLLTMAALLVFAGGTLLLAGLDGREASIAETSAIAVIITGAGLATSAFLVPARGLLALGAVLAAPLVVTAGTDVALWSGAGERRVEIASPDDLRGEYRYGLGELVVDMRRLELGGADRSVDIGLIMGEIRVYVPDSVEVVIDAEVGAGSVETWRRGRAGEDPVDPFFYGTGNNYRNRSGIGVDHDLRLLPVGDPAGRLRIELDLGAGTVQVITVPSPS